MSDYSNLSREELIDEIERLREAISYMGNLAGRLKCESVKMLALDYLDDGTDERR